MLEQSYWSGATRLQNSQFVTLTYRDAELPFTQEGFATLDPRHTELYLKRLRKEQRIKLRYFLVGEYGDETFRPHYHAALFNFPRCERGQTKRSPITNRRLWKECCPTCRMVGSIWGKGDIEVRDLDEGKCEYLAGYVTKKLTKKEDPRLAGRFPEFPRQSRMPVEVGQPGGIGAPALAKLAEPIKKAAWHGFKIYDVPLFAMHGKKQMPLGRYLRSWLRHEVGLPKKAPQEVIEQAWIDTMLPLLLAARQDKHNPSLKGQIQKESRPYLEKLKLRRALHKRGPL